LIKENTQHATRGKSGTSDVQLTDSKILFVKSSTNYLVIKVPLLAMPKQRHKKASLMNKSHNKF